MQQQIAYLLKRDVEKDHTIERMQIKIIGLESKIVGLEAEIYHVNRKLLAIDNILHMDEYTPPERSW